MAFYIVNLLLLSVIIVNCKERKRKMLIAYVWLTIVLACRGIEIGEDNENYMTYFSWYKTLDWKHAFLRVENGYWLLNKLIAAWGGTFQVLLICCAVLAMAGVCWFIYKESYYPTLSIWFYITMICYQSTMTRVRQAIAISIVLVAYHYAKERKFLKFSLLVILASSFHITAIVAFIMYVVVNKKITKMMITMAVVALAVLYSFRRTLLNIAFLFVQNAKFAGYFDDSSAGGESMLFIEMILLVLSLLMAYNFRNSENSSLYTACGYYAFFAMALQVFALIIPIFNRMTDYFFVPLMLMIPNTFKGFETRQRAIYIMMGLAFTFTFYIYMLSISDSSVMHYIPFWMKNHM